MNEAVVLNDKDCYIMGCLIVKKAFSKGTAIHLSKNNIEVAEKLVACKAIQKHGDKYWIKE